MRQSLQIHPDSRCDALTGIHAEIGRTRPGGMAVRFTAHGKIGELIRAPLHPAERANDLWKSTCFEVFLRATREQGYREFNFSPSSEWAAYSFSGYREGMHDLAIAAPASIVTANERELTLQVQIGFKDAPTVSNSVWQLGLSAVIEEIGGRKSYWALRHPAGKPDFHHPDCFALELPPP